MKWLRLLGVAVGLTLATLLIYEVGWASIWHTLTLLGWSYSIVLVYPLTWILCNTAGLRHAFRKHISVPFLRLVEIRLAGETFNSLLPSGYVGGEPLKAKLLSQSMPLREAASAVLIAKAAQSVALVIFLGIGLTLAGHPAIGSSHHAPWIALGLLSVGILIFTQLLAHRTFRRIGNALHRLTRWQWLAAQEKRLDALDETLGAFYREGKAQFGVSVLWHLGGWLAGALEVRILFLLLHYPFTWKDAWFMGAMAQLAAIIGLMAPAGVGFYEGGHYLAAVVLGIPPSLGVSVSLIRRVREIFWDGVGIGLFSKVAKEKKTV